MRTLKCERLCNNTNCKNTFFFSDFCNDWSSTSTCSATHTSCNEYHLSTCKCLNIQFGVSQTDVRTLSEGMPATVTLDGKTYYGFVSSIALLPDETTRTYPVTVQVDDQGDELFLGSMATVQLGLGERSGVWLPLSVILNDGQDYVYIVQDGHALRRDVTINEVSNDQVLVSGLEVGCPVISDGMKTVRSGSAVKILDESGDETA